MTTWYVLQDEKSDVVVQVTDGVVSSVPKDEADSDYQAYLAWLAEGNTPEPWPTEES